jgi:PIN domain nuclease of toxin-antitoxin system
MRVLLDTDVLLRALAGDPAVEKIRDILLSEETEIFVSAVSWWDIAVRIESGTLRADLKELREAAVESGFLELPLRGEHVGSLPALSGSGIGLNASSFALMIAAQAEVEPLRLISCGSRLAGRAPIMLRM